MVQWILHLKYPAMFYLAIPIPRPLPIHKTSLVDPVTSKQFTISRMGNDNMNACNLVTECMQSGCMLDGKTETWWRRSSRETLIH